MAERLHDPYEDWDTTFSIVAADPSAGELGGAVATRRPAVGTRIPLIAPGVAAVASQAQSNPWLAVAALELLRHRLAPEGVLASVLAMDPTPVVRQLHFVTADGRTAQFTGNAAPDWHGHAAGEHVSVAANHCVGPAVVDDMLRAFQTTSGDLAERLMAALEAGDAAGGDARGKQSAALSIYRAEPFPWIEVRVDDHQEPVRELRRLLTIYRDERNRRNRALSEFLKHDLPRAQGGGA